MNLLILGAAGKTGKLVLEQALALGHTVTVLLHSDPTDPKQASHPQDTALPAGVHIFHGDVRNPSKLEQAMAGQQAVIDCIGGTKPFLTTDLETSAARVVIDVMKRQQVSRLIVVSALGEGSSVAHTGFFYEHLLMPTMLRGIVEDKRNMESVVEASGLSFTIVRPPILSDSDHVGTPHVVAPGEVAHKISRRDLAEFLVNQLSDQTYVGQAVTITGK